MASIILLSEIPTLSLLYKLSRLQPPPSTSTPAPPSPSQSLNSKISLLRTDITTLHVSAIVNAANESLRGGGGVDGAIHCAAGEKLLEECRTLNGCLTGSAKITSAYDLPCEKVIHAVGPVYWRAKRSRPGSESELLRGCYRRSLELAVENGLKSVAFSALSTGVFGYPSGEAAEVAAREVRRFLVEEDKGGVLERVVFCCFERKDERAYEEWLPKFFPPTEQDLSAKEQQKQVHDGGLIAAMPDPPTSEPVEEGQPEAKKQKVDFEEPEEEWEAVEKPEGSDMNGLLAGSVGEKEEQIEKQIEVEEAKEELSTAMHTAEAGGDPPQNNLLKDW